MEREREKEREYYYLRRDVDKGIIIDSATVIYTIEGVICAACAACGTCIPCKW
jgi:hypothetical protein